MDEIIAGIAVVVVTVPTWVLPRFIGRLATSPAFFLIFGALQLAVASPVTRSPTTMVGIGGPLRLSRSWVPMTSGVALRSEALLKG